MLARTRSKSSAASDHRVIETVRGDNTRRRGGSVRARIAACHAHGLGIVVARVDTGARQETPGGNGKDARAATEIEDAAEPPSPRQAIEGFEAAARGGVMCRAERFAGIDLDGIQAESDSLAIVTAMNDETSGFDGRQSRLADGHPILVRHVLDVHDGWCGDEIGEPCEQGRGVRRHLVIGFDLPTAGGLVLEHRHGVGRRLLRSTQPIRQLARLAELGDLQ